MSPSLGNNILLDSQEKKLFPLGLVIKCILYHAVHIVNANNFGVFFLIVVFYILLDMR